jgi:Xaa-Pro aminopeptidase
MTSLPTAARIERLARLRRHLDDRALGAVVLTRPEHLRYLAGTHAGGLPAGLILTRTIGVLVAADGSVPPDTLRPLDIELCVYRGYEAGRLVDHAGRMLEALDAAARRLGLRGSVGVEAAHVTHAALRAIPDAVPQDVAATLARWREVKDDTERALIQDRVAALDAAYAAVRSAIHPGATERDVLAAAYRALLERVDEPLVLNYNLASGLRTAQDNPRATARRLEAGDLVLVDLYPVLDGYVADLTRTFVVGKPTTLQRERHAALEAALQAAESCLRPGASVSRIDDAIRAALRAAGGYETTMGHHSGHGIGLLAWEEPWIGPDTPGTLTEGMTIAIEPGLYLPGWGGMRLEGNYLVTASGFERLDRFPSALVSTDE